MLTGPTPRGRSGRPSSRCPLWSRTPSPAAPSTSARRSAPAPPAAQRRIQPPAPHARSPAAWAEAQAARRGADCGAGRCAPPPPRTKWTRRVPHPVLIGHAASLSQTVVRDAAQRGLRAHDAKRPGLLHTHSRDLGGLGGVAALAASDQAAASSPPPPPLVLSGHAASLTPY